MKSNLLKYNLQKKLLSITLTESQTEKSIQHQYINSANQYLSESFESLENLRTYLMQDCNISKRGQQEGPAAVNASSRNQMNEQLARNALMSQ